MSESSRAAVLPSEPSDSEPQRKGTPVWVAALFLLLLMVVFIVAQVVSRTGPPVAWKYDYAEALQQARNEHKRLFLLLYKPGCPLTANHDRELFSTRRVRERLTQFVCCRLEVQRNDLIARRFGLTNDPLMLVLDEQEHEISRLTGAVDLRQFETYVHPSPQR